MVYPLIGYHLTYNSKAPSIKTHTANTSLQKQTAVQGRMPVWQALDRSKKKTIIECGKIFSTGRIYEKQKI